MAFPKENSFFGRLSYQPQCPPPRIRLKNANFNFVVVSPSLTLAVDTTSTAVWVSTSENIALGETRRISRTFGGDSVPALYGHPTFTPPRCWKGMGVVRACFQTTLALKRAFQQLAPSTFLSISGGKGAVHGTVPLHTLGSTSQQEPCDTSVP